MIGDSYDRMGILWSEGANNPLEKHKLCSTFWLYHLAVAILQLISPMGR